MTEKTINMVLVKSTKGTHVYSAEDEADPIHTVYVQRESLPKNPPENITLTIKWGE